MNRENRGFTLIEVLVVLTLTGLLTTVLFATFRTGLHSTRVADRFVAAAENERQLLQLLQRHLNTLQSLPITQQGRPTPSFIGDSSSLRYIAPLSMSAAGTPFLIELTTDNQGTSIQFGVYDAELEVDDMLSGSERLQISDSLQLSFSFYLKLGPDDNGRWVETWEGDKGLPNLIAVSLAGSVRDYPQLIFKPRGMQEQPMFGDLGDYLKQFQENLPPPAAREANRPDKIRARRRQQ